MSGGDRYRPGDHWVSDDRTGERIRYSDSRKEWTGAIVHKDDFEERHPQDFIRGVRDNQAVPDPRPPPPAVFGGATSTEISTDTVAGATSIPVVASTGFEAGHRVAIMMDNRERYLGTVQSVPDSTTIAITAALPWATGAGNAVINYSAVAADNIE